MNDTPSPWLSFTFSRGNPAGPDQANYPALLRAVAESIEELGDIQVTDRVLHNEITADGDWPSITVYYAPRNDMD